MPILQYQVVLEYVMGPIGQEGWPVATYFKLLLFWWTRLKGTTIILCHRSCGCVNSGELWLNLKGQVGT